MPIARWSMLVMGRAHNLRATGGHGHARFKQAGNRKSGHGHYFSGRARAIFERATGKIRAFSKWFFCVLFSPFVMQYKPILMIFHFRLCSNVNIFFYSKCTFRFYFSEIFKIQVDISSDFAYFLKILMPECKSGMPAGNGTGNKRARALPEFQIWLRAGTGTQKFGRARAKNGHARARPITRYSVIGN